MIAVNHVISVGPACPCAFALKTSQLKTFSCPFDWIISSPNTIKDCIDTKFKHLIDKDLLYHTSDRTGDYCHHQMYGKNTFHHHCPLHNAAHAHYFERCIQRFNAVLEQRHARRVLFVHMTISKAVDPDFKENISVLYDALKPCRILGIQCVENSAKRGCVIETTDESVTIATVKCVSANCGVRLENALDNAAVASVLRWYCYDLDPPPESGSGSGGACATTTLGGEREEGVWPYNILQKKRVKWWKKWMCA